MKKRWSILSPFSFNKQQQLTLPIFVIGVVLNLAWVVYEGVHGFFRPRDLPALWVAFGFSLYFLVVFLFINPLMSRKPGARWMLMGLNYLAAIPLAWIQMRVPFGIFPTFSLCLLILVAIFNGRWPSYGFLLITILADYIFRGVTIFNTEARFQVDFFILPISSILITETIVRLENLLVRETRRLQTLNNVARSLTSSLEMHQVIALVSSTIQSALSADTYYLGFIHGDSIHMELMYDDGEFFPSAEIPLEGSLAERVITARTPLLINDLAPEPGDTPHYRVVGKPKISLSWMGCALESASEVFGIVAVASYKRYAFDEGDLDLIVNIAQQASIAIANAGHHAEVETRSKLDSLTGVLNHNAFLSELDFHAREASTFQTPLCLIMLDIDRFKKYNDTYGHLVGDRVLVELTRKIKNHIHKTDHVGRWGGEEFAILLPNTELSQAYNVAKRISDSLAQLTILDRDNQPVPCPTVSQGIAILPEECSAIEELIDLADRRLYLAKGRGRNQIEPVIEGQNSEEDRPEASGD